MRITVEIPDQTLRDILTTAVEQGCAYWANDYNNGRGNRVTRDASGDVETFTLGHSDDGAACGKVIKRSVTPNDLGRALSKHGARFPHILQAAISGDVDALQADAVLQLAVFGDIVFG